VRFGRTLVFLKAISVTSGILVGFSAWTYLQGVAEGCALSVTAKHRYVTSRYVNGNRSYIL
jgi:hypothetical protein